MKVKSHAASKKLIASTNPDWTIGQMAERLPDVQSRSGRAITFDDLYQWKIVGAPQVSPDGTQIVASVQSIDKASDEYRSTLWQFSPDGGEPRQLTSGRWSDTSPRWSPDGRSIAFVSNRDDKTPQLFLLPIDGGEAQPLTSGKLGVGSFEWSPNGDRIAFTAKVGPDGIPSDKEEDDDNEKSDVKVISSVRYKFDGQGFLEDKVSQIFTVEVEGDAPPKRLTDDTFDASDIAWSPDGKWIAFVSNRNDDWQKSRTRDIWTMKPSGKDLTCLTNGKGHWGSPVWSPDSKTIALLGNDDVSKNEVSAWLWTMPATGGKPKRHGKNLDRPIGDASMSGPAGGSDQAIRWLPDGSAIDALVSDRGSTVVVRIPISRGTPTVIAGRGRHVKNFAHLDGGDSLLITAAEPTTLIELYRVDASGESRLSRFNDAWLQNVYVAEPEEFWIESDGRATQGWLLRPDGNTSKSKKQVPLVLNIHGGPHAQFSNAFFHELQVYPANGMALAYINPVGSMGRENEFAQAINAHWGVADMPNFMDAVDHCVSLGGIDPKRIGVTGGSYGGFSTNWLLGHTDRFSAAVTDRSISNMISMYGTDDIALVSLDPEMGTPWENVEAYWDASPLKYVENFSAPLLIVHSEHDYRCPMEQAEQLYLALHRLDKPVKFIRFPDESHGLSRDGKPKHRIERFEHTIGWFTEHL